MKQNTETELNAVFDKTIAFLRDKWGNMRHDIALEITRKSDDEVRVIWDKVTTFLEHGRRLFYTRIQQNSAKSTENLIVLFTGLVRFY